MAEEAVTTEEKPAEEQQEEKPSEEKTDADIEEIASQAQNPDAVRNALKSERSAAKQARERADELATQVKQFEDRDKSEQEKLEERATKAESAAKAFEAQLLRYGVAVEKHLPLELADRLQGDTKGQLEKDADRLLELVKRDDKPAGDADGGKGEGAAGSSFNDILRRNQ